MAKAAQIYAGNPPPGANTRVLRASVSAVAEPLEKRLRTKWDFKTIALTVGAMALASTGIGLVGSYGLDRWRNSHQANQKKTVLSDVFRNQIAATLGIKPSQVTAKHLEEAARIDGVLRNVVSKVNAEQANDNRSALLSNGAIMAAGGFLPGVGGIAKLAVDGGAMIAGGAVSSLFDKDVLQLTDVLSQIEGKKGVTEHDLMLLRISQDEKWQKAFKQTNGYAFHKGTPEQQRRVMNNMGELPDFTQMAVGINTQLQSGQLGLADIPEMVVVNRAPSFAGRVASQRAAAAQSSAAQAMRPPVGNHAAAIEAQRAAAGAISTAMPT